MGYCILHVIEIRYYLLLLHKILVKTKRLITILIFKRN